VDLVRDLLDKRVVDRNGRDMGRVDGIELEVPADGPPRVIAVLIGPSVLGQRLHPIVGRWVVAIEQAMGFADGRPIRIPVGEIRDIDRDIKVDDTLGASGALQVEQAARQWLKRLPGSQ
jgi:sporulation protein YlmC with PRC-barrel domain